jgi:hypothetical protein
MSTVVSSSVDPIYAASKHRVVGLGPSLALAHRALGVRRKRCLAGKHVDAHRAAIARL